MCPCHKPEINKIRSNFNYILHSGPLESLDDDTYQTTLLWLSHAWTGISNVICGDIFVIFNKFRWEVIVSFGDIDGIVKYHCLNFLFTKV